MKPNNVRKLVKPVIKRVNLSRIHIHPYLVDKGPTRSNSSIEEWGANVLEYQLSKNRPICFEKSGAFIAVTNIDGLSLAKLLCIPKQHIYVEIIDEIEVDFFLVNDLLVDPIIKFIMAVEIGKAYNLVKSVGLFSTLQSFGEPFKNQKAIANTLKFNKKTVFPVQSKKTKNTQLHDKGNRDDGEKITLRISANEEENGNQNK